MEAQTRELLPRVLPLGNDARAILVSFADEIEKAQVKGGSLSHITGHASKAAEQACRIAGVLTLWRDLHAPEVTARDMADAITLAQFYLSEAVRLSDAAMVSVEIYRAETLRKWLLESCPHSEVLARDVQQFGPNGLREITKLQAAIGLLEKHGHLVALEPGTIVRGAARKNAWRIVRADNVV